MKADRVKHDRMVTPVPTIGFDVETVESTGTRLSHSGTWEVSTTPALCGTSNLQTQLCAVQLMNAGCVDVGPEDQLSGRGQHPWLKDWLGSRSD